MKDTNASKFKGAQGKVQGKAIDILARLGTYGLTDRGVGLGGRDQEK